MTLTEPATDADRPSVFKEPEMSKSLLFFVCSLNSNGPLIVNLASLTGKDVFVVEAAISVEITAVLTDAISDCVFFRIILGVFGIGARIIAESITFWTAKGGFMYL